MKRNTIKWRLIKFNLVLIIMLITLTTIIFNIAVRKYIEKEIIGQLDRIASHTEDTALLQGPDFFPGLPGPEREPNPPPPFPDAPNNDLVRFYFMLDRSLREPLSVLNADYILLDKDKNRITPFPEESFKPPAELLSQINDQMKLKSFNDESYLNFHLSGAEYIAIIKPVSQKNSFGLGWIIIYSSLQEVNQLQKGINIILLVILIFSALIISLFSSQMSKKISAVFISLNQHIRAIAERNFGAKIYLQADDELHDFVNNINIMTEKLETYDQAQKTFLQNVSHEFRTPLMSIQSYAEGIKYDVVDSDAAADIIIGETRRMTNLVEDLLYLSRLDAIEENYHFDNLNFNKLIDTCIDRMSGIAVNSNKKITSNELDKNIEIYADEEKISRAITNIISNCIRYANSTIEILLNIIENNRVEIKISDDGSGFEENELPYIFERFYKGKKGNYGLGLAISKNVIEKHNGMISAENSASGAVFRIELPTVESRGGQATNLLTY
ncbi:HAMP domain-containing histidine kinase [Pelotomaculum terephthalicicum JT]|nr:HAMP domain-containing histidine kinase [Pelotomaculum terephthalicicum JT]